MSRPSLFDHRPDPELGAALREALQAEGDDAAFAHRVLARIGGATANGGAWWDVLGRWALPGVAAALVMVTAATFWLSGRQVEPEVTAGALEDTMRRSGEAVTPLVLLAASRPPDLDVVLASVLEGER